MAGDASNNRGPQVGRPRDRRQWRQHPFPGGEMSVSIIIVSYNGRDLLGPCLEATVAQADDEGAEVVVVDNGSSDGTAELVRQSFPDVVLARNQSNVGFAEGCNAGVRAARGD